MPRKYTVEVYDDGSIRILLHAACESVSCDSLTDAMRKIVDTEIDARFNRAMVKVKADMRW